MNIYGKRIYLRAIEEEDIPILHRWANDPMLQNLLENIYFPSSLDFHKRWFQKLKDDPLRQRFAVVNEEHSIIGISSLVDIDWRNRHAHHGLTLGDPAARGKGYGKDAVMTTMRYAFDELGLERLNGSRIEYNVASKVFYDKLGWSDEGVRRNYYFRHGQYYDQIVSGILKQDYKNLVETTQYWR